MEYDEYDEYGSLTRPVLAVHMTVQECTKVFKILYIQPSGICSVNQSSFEVGSAAIK